MMPKRPATDSRPIDMQPGWRDFLIAFDPELPSMLERWAVARRVTITSVMMEVNQRQWEKQALRVRFEDRARDRVYSSAVVHRPLDDRDNVRMFPWMIEVGDKAYEVLR